MRQRRRIFGARSDSGRWVDNWIDLFWALLAIVVISSVYVALPNRYHMKPDWQEAAVHVMFASVFIAVVSVRTVVVRSGIASLRTAAFRVPIASAVSKRSVRTVEKNLRADRFDIRCHKATQHRIQPGIRALWASHGIALACLLGLFVIAAGPLRHSRERVGPESWGSIRHIRHTPIRPSIKVTTLCRNFLSS
jgi:hypothetical protein